MQITSAVTKSDITFDPQAQLRTAVLFLVFNRPKVTAQVFEAIRQAKPLRLYVAADGPRSNRPDDSTRCTEVRRTATAVDWPCEIYTLFRDENLGCRRALQSAIDWFFEYEVEGIVLEDDCLPHEDFFKYCDWALETYREEKDVWHINGNNFQAPDSIFKECNLSFTSLAQVWGWATWRDRWRCYEGNPFYLMDRSKEKKAFWRISPLGEINKLNHISALQRGLDTWDFQWQVTILNNQGLCLSCQSNLISNLGDGTDATHTRKSDARIHLATQAIDKPLEYKLPNLNKHLNAWYEKKMGLRHIKSACNYIVNTGVTYLIQYVKRLF